jgi:trans-aconitate 2-methyltransferase
MPADAWDPAQYERFRDERAAPFHDLLAMVRPGPGPRVLDLGCGTGELTRLAHQRLGAAETLGLDASASMLEKAQAQAGQVPGGKLRFERRDLREAGGSWDVVLSNAALQWLPDHASLVPALARLLAPGGQLAVQVPDNHDHPAHRIARETGEEAPFAAALGGWKKERTVLPPERYAELLYGAGLRRVEAQVRVYLHELPGPDQVIEWVKGTLLNDWKQRLSEGHWVCYLSRYRERILAELPDAHPYLYTFRRVLFCGTREA